MRAYNKPSVELVVADFKLWVNADTNMPVGLKRVYFWAIFSICSPSLCIQEDIGLSEAIAANLNIPKNDFDQCAAIHLSVLKEQWTADEFKYWINENKTQKDQLRLQHS